MNSERFAILFALWACSAIAAPVPKQADATSAFVVWQDREDFGSNDPSNPLVFKDLVIVGTGKGELRAYRGADGTLAWKHIDGNRIYRQPASDGERVFFAAAQGVTALAGGDGKVLWRHQNANFSDAAIGAGKAGMLFAAGDDGVLYALETKAGRQLWTSDFIKDAPPDPPGFEGARARGANGKARPSAVVVHGDAVFLTVFDQCRVVVVAADTGKRLWSYQTGGWIGGTAAVTDAVVLVGSQDRSMHCLDRKTGKLLWKNETKGRTDTGGAVDDKFVYFGSTDGHVHCLDLSTGRNVWEFRVDPQANGRGSSMYSVPLVGKREIHVGAGEGQFYAIDKEKGTLRWKLRPNPGAEIFSSPATDGTLFFVASRVGGKGSVSGLSAIGAK